MNYNIHQYNLRNTLGAPLGMPLNIPSVQYASVAPNTQPQKPTGISDVPGAHLPRAVTYLADYGGCALWRCLAPDFVINLYGKGVIHELTTMVLDERFYQGVKAVKIQRQATPIQLSFVRELKRLSEKLKFKIIYEVDDIVLGEDIPMYNKNREAFTSKEIRSSIIDIMQLADEVVNPSRFMRDYYMEKTGNKNGTYVPNFLFRWWFDRYYDLDNLVRLYNKNKKRPVISIFASGTHVDVANRTNQQDDFTPVIRAIIKTRKMFNWTFYGSYPLPLKSYITGGEMTFKPWVQLPDYARTIAESGSQLTFACLLDNNFNRAKSNIKLSESGAMGIPCVCPDMVTYDDALLKYSNENDFIDVIQDTLKSSSRYAGICKKSRALAETYWLENENNIGQHVEAYFTPFDDPKRKFITK